ncbi:c-type cytochrome [Tropicimonas aquimaris]|uniref:C-type cytochrome n=1 Tax=Tropicimonas aquimaris TaxID=914152 RepID=A0ABW3IQ93_9RHOB
MSQIRTMKTMLAAAAVVALAAGAAWGQENQSGRAEYLGACASCHGVDAHGGGEVAKYLNVEVPDLTTLAERNGGVFPMLEVIHIIDGRSGVRGHGDETPVWGTGFRLTDREALAASGEMPAWGDLFRSAIGEDAGPFGAETIVRGRMLSLALYLESIQK